MNSDKPKKTWKHLLPWKISIIFSAVILLCTACGRLKATTMSLIKTEGTVSIDNDKGKQIEPVDNLKLYSGYEMLTEEISYAWINLDHVKLVKMDEESEIEIQKDGKELEIRVNTGNLFFHVKEPLEDDETMDIRTSTMAVGIRGTCGWVTKESKTHSSVCLLEGTVILTTRDGETAEINAGQKADVETNEKGESEINVSEFIVRDIPEFIMTDITQDEDLAETILEASGLNVLNPGEEPTTVAYNAVIEEYQNILSDIRDLAGDGEIPYYEWSTDYLPDYQEKYPNVSGGLMEFIISGYDLCYASQDIDGNGIEELIVGYYDPASHIPHPVSIHTFDGTDAVTRDAFYYELLGDGLLLETGNGYVSGRVYRIGSDGYTWEEVTDPDIQRGVNVSDLDLSSHDGFLRESLDWNELHENSSLEYILRRNQN